jgi:hypothetical protein
MNEDRHGVPKTGSRRSTAIAIIVTLAYCAALIYVNRNAPSAPLNAAHYAAPHNAPGAGK